MANPWNWISTNFNALRKNRFLTLGIPFFILVIGGSFGLEQFARIRYDYRKQTGLTPEVAAKYGITMKKPGQVTLESEFAKLEKMDIDTWENIRGPRPWEEPVPGAVHPPQIEVPQKKVAS